MIENLALANASVGRADPSNLFADLRDRCPPSPISANRSPSRNSSDEQTVYDDDGRGRSVCDKEDRITATTATSTDTATTIATTIATATTVSSSTWFSQAKRRCAGVRDWLAKMCSCLDSGPAYFNQPVGKYQRLGAKNYLSDFSLATNDGRRMRFAWLKKAREQVAQSEMEELRFHCDDLTSYSVIVESNLRTSDLCELLRVKKSVAEVSWSIVEAWPDLGIERTLEDHEDVLAVHRETKPFASKYKRRFFYRQDYLKYEFFVDAAQFFPIEMISVPALFADDGRTPAELLEAIRSSLGIEYQQQQELAVGKREEDVTENEMEDETEDETEDEDMLEDGDLMSEGVEEEETANAKDSAKEEIEWPRMFSLAWIRIERLNVWRRTHVLLRDRKLYLAKKATGQVIPYASFTDFAPYRITNAKRSFGAPFPWGICLRPVSRDTADHTGTVSGESRLKVIAFHSEKSRACWLTAMRLAKYGKQLRENYRAFKNKQCEQSDNPKDRYVNYNVSNESSRSRVAMDFTGSVGRIVEDPKEAKNIAENEGVNWRRTWRPFSRPPPGCAVLRLHGLDDGIHVLQPWFHRGLKRDIAATIVRDHGSVDGVFLVRESKSNLGAYVLTYKYSDKVFHAQIQPVFDERCNCWLYSLDKGITRFYDLLQLIEFYQLNAGCLPTRLTHYVRNSVATGLPLSATEDDRGDSPSPRYAGTPSVSVAFAAGHRSI